VKIETVPIGKVRLNPDNPRTINKDKYAKLVKSLGEFPEMRELREIVVDETYMVLGGNMRLRALKEIGEKEVIVKIAEGLTPEQKKEFVIKDNASFGDWDFDIIANEFTNLALEDWGLDIPEIKPDASPISIQEEEKTVKCPECGHVFNHENNQ
jgi:ParB-like chromosome segregation protein Spo0J